MANHRSFRIAVFMALILCGFSLISARAQLLVAQFNTGTIREYTDTGVLMNGNFITTGGGSVGDMRIVGNDLYVLTDTTIMEYTTSGTLLNASVVSNLSGAEQFVISGSNIYVTSYSGNSVGEYTLSGATVNSALIKNLASPIGITVAGGNLYVTNPNTHDDSQGHTLPGYGYIGEYSLTGQAVNASFISGLTEPMSIETYGGNIFVADDTGAISEYYTSGTLVNSQVGTGLHNPGGMTFADGNLYATDSSKGLVASFALDGSSSTNPFISGVSDAGTIVALPEPSTWALVLATGTLLFASLRRLGLRVRVSV